MATVAWIVIVDADLDDYLVGAQMTALRSSALQTSPAQTNPFPRIMADVAGRIRKEIQACGRNVLSSTANSIPPSFKSLACALIIEAMTVRLAPAIALTEDQRTQARDAREYLKRVAKCEVPVEEPTTPADDDTQDGTPIVVVTKSTRKVRRSMTNGLI